MAKYSIKELERLSGIKAHTLRIWEKRFDLLKPKRTDTNIRYYADEDVKKLLNVALLCKSGQKISKVAALSDNGLHKAVQSLEKGNFASEKRMDDFIKSMIDLDEIAFNKTFEQTVENYGFRKSFTDVIFPFLKKVGVLWLCNEIQPIHEHFVSNLIRNKLITATDALPLAESNVKGVLFLPEDEFHELGLVFFNFLLKQSGVKTYYLGQTTPIAEVKGVVENVDADFTLSYSMKNNKQDLQKHLNQLEAIEIKQNYYLKHESQSDIKLQYPPGVCLLNGIDDLFEKIL